WLLARPPPGAPLSPYTTLFRSVPGRTAAGPLRGGHGSAAAAAGPLRRPGSYAVARARRRRPARGPDLLGPRVPPPRHVGAALEQPEAAHARATQDLAGVR